MAINPASPPPLLQVSVVYSPAPRKIQQCTVTLALGSTVADAVKQSGLLAACSDAQVDALAVGVWGHKVHPAHRLHDGDRVEIYRALKVDPKVARRERFARQGARTTGLFARRRPGAKSGY